MRDQRDHRSASGQRAEGVHAGDAGAGHVDGVGDAGNVGGLQVVAGGELAAEAREQGGREASESGRDQRERVEGGLVARGEHELAYAADPATRIAFADRRGQAHPRELVAAHRVLVGAQRDRDGDRHGRDLDAEGVVVAREGAEQGGHERVVDRGADRLRRGAQVGERDLERLEAPAQAPRGQQRRRRGRRRSGDALERAGVGDRVGRQAVGAPQRVAGEAQATGGEAGRLSRQPAHAAREVVQQHVPAARRLGGWGRWLRLVRRRRAAA